MLSASLSHKFLPGRNKDNCNHRQLDLHGLHVMESVETLDQLIEFCVKDKFQGAWNLSALLGSRLGISPYTVEAGLSATSCPREWRPAHVQFHAKPSRQLVTFQADGSLLFSLVASACGNKGSTFFGGLQIRGWRL